MKILAALGLALSISVAPFAIVPSNACTNSYDTAKDGSNCGGRASGCKSGGRGGYC